MQCFDLLGDRGAFAKKSALAQLGHDFLTGRFVFPELFFPGSRQESEVATELHMRTAEISSRRRQIVRGHRGQAQVSIALRRHRPVLVPLEPQDGGAEDTPLAEVVADPRLHRAQIFTDDHGPGPVRLEHEDADHRLVVIAHVRSLVRLQTLRDPPEPEQADHVVDT